MGYCTQCGKETDWASKSGYCRECAAEALKEQKRTERKPFYKKWWLWAICIVVIGCTVAFLLRQQEYDKLIECFELAGYVNDERTACYITTAENMGIEGLSLDAKERIGKTLLKKAASNGKSDYVFAFVANNKRDYEFFAAFSYGDDIGLTDFEQNMALVVIDALSESMWPESASVSAPSPTPAPTPEPFEPVSVSGKGDNVERIELPFGAFRAFITHDGEANFSIWDYVDNEGETLLVNEIGKYDGAHLLKGNGHDFAITADGEWEITIERIEEIDTLQGGAIGDSCVGYYVAKAGDCVYSFTHDGEANFAVWLYTDRQTDLLVNEIGAYEGEKRVSFEEG